jgi:putative serine protease PepD
VLTPATLPQPVVPATIGGGAAVGNSVVAIGNPLGLTYSVSSGVVSAIGRTADTNTGKFTGLIQFDASVNPGSSGGPLLDAQGDVIGIVLSIADPSHDDSFAGIAFAVPIGTALGGGPGGGGGPQT